MRTQAGRVRNTVKAVGMSSDTAPPCVLVIDDDPDVLSTVEQILEGEGYTVAGARNGLDALSVLDSVTPDVILLDLMMPVMDGWEFRRRLKCHHAAATPVIVVSADRDISRKAASIAADGYVAKPFDLDDLLYEVGRFIRR
jgi:two-component system chemotaxis response regulator CheY